MSENPCWSPANYSDLPVDPFSLLPIPAIANVEDGCETDKMAYHPYWNLHVIDFHLLKGLGWFALY